MIVVISPSKKMSFACSARAKQTEARFSEEAFELVGDLRKLSVQGIANMMKLSDKLAEVNYQRYQDFQPVGSSGTSRCAVDCFKGDVYTGLDVGSYQDSDVSFAQKRLRILSGMFGLLRPLDLVQPHRLEMGTRLKNSKGKNLYEFWRERVTNMVNLDAKSSGASMLLNLASDEYFKVLDCTKLEPRVVKASFKERKGDGYKAIMLYAKRARGMMASFVIKNKIKNLEDLKKFSEDGYNFNPEVSKFNELVFTR